VTSLYEPEAKVRHLSACIMSVNSILDLVVNDSLSRWKPSPMSNPLDNVVFSNCQSKVEFASL
jgi:hypothetical protein